MRKDPVDALAQPVTPGNAVARTASGSWLVLIVAACVVLACAVLALAWQGGYRPVTPPTATQAPALASSSGMLTHTWGGASPIALNVAGRGFGSLETVRIYLAPSLDASFVTFRSLADAQAAADGSIVVTAIDLGPDPGAVRGWLLFGIGQTSGTLIVDGPLNDIPVIPTVAPPTPIPATPVPPTPTPIPTPTPVPTPLPPWEEVYYRNRDQIEPTAYARYSHVLDYNWGNRSPVPGVGADNFSAVFTRQLQIPQLTSLVFTLKVEGAAKVYVDEELVIDQWFLGPRRTAHGTYCPTAGTSTIRVEYYTGYDAAVSLSWREGFRAWAVRYYNTPDLQPPLVLVCDDDVIDFNWGEGAPERGVNFDNFSINWERLVSFPFTGDYDFVVDADDNARVILDGQILAGLDTWNADGPAVRSQRVRVRAGMHAIQVQYRERTGIARIKFTINPVAPPPPA